MLVSEHNFNYLELQLFLGAKCVVIRDISPSCLRASVFSSHHERLEVICFWNAPNHIWVLVLHYLWSFSLSVALVLHLIAFSTLPLPLKEENSSLHADQSCKSRNGPKLSSNSTYEPLQVTLDEISVPWVHTAWPLLGFGPAPQRHNFRRPVFGCMCVYYMQASRMVSLWHLFTQNGLFCMYYSFWTGPTWL